MAKYKIKFEIEYDGNEEAIKRVVDHHIEELVNLDEWPEIKSIYNAKIEEV